MECQGFKRRLLAFRCTIGVLKYANRCELFTLKCHCGNVERKRGIDDNQAVNVLFACLADKLVNRVLVERVNVGNLHEVAGDQSVLVNGGFVTRHEPIGFSHKSITILRTGALTVHKDFRGTATPASATANQYGLGTAHLVERMTLRCLAQCEDFSMLFITRINAHDVGHTVAVDIVHGDIEYLYFFSHKEKRALRIDSLVHALIYDMKKP